MVKLHFINQKACLITIMKRVTKMTCLGPYEIFTFFLHLVLLLANYSFSMSNYLNTYKKCVFILTVSSRINLFIFPHKICVVYLYFTGYQMKA